MQSDTTTRKRQSRRNWVQACTEGERSAVDGLTDCERRVIETLYQAGYELTGRKFRRQIAQKGRPTVIGG